MNGLQSSLAICAGRRRTERERIVDGARETTIRAFDLRDLPEDAAKIIDDAHKTFYPEWRSDEFG